MKNLLVLIVLLMLTIPLTGQYLNWTPIDESNIKEWKSEVLSVYLGVYRFGDSEGESTLVLFDTGEKILGQIQTGKWTGEGDKIKWVIDYANLSNVAIAENGAFSSDQYRGAFVVYTEEEKEPLSCLKIYDAWSLISERQGDYELGPKMNVDLFDHFNGKYPQSSYEKLSYSSLKEKSLIELKIMRNEIFARYGYSFKKEGEMDLYFSQQDWYRPQYQNVDAFLTDVEKKNVEMIRKVELEKKNSL